MANLKIPPQNEEAEASVLGAILIDKDAISVVSQLISSSDFYNQTNALIYIAMLALYEEGKPIDVLTLTSQLKKEKAYNKVGSSYLANVVNAVPTAANVEQYALLIKEAST